MRLMEWEIKVSKLCNLRCKYCYEFDELGDPRHISIDGWRHILESARWYQEELERRNPGEDVRTNLIWHGGEPLLLPRDYYEEVMALEREVLGAEKLNTVFWNHLTTNLYNVPWDTMDLLKREGFELNVSFDLIPGARVTAGGRGTEARVRANLERVLAEGWRTQVSTVVAAHDATRLPEIYDSLRTLSRGSKGELYVTFIPIYSAPWSATPNGRAREANCAMDADALVDAFYALFEHWLEDPDAMDTSPIGEYFVNVLNKLRQGPRQYYDRRGYGETLLVVNTDGYLYVIADSYDREKSLGCLFEKPFAEMLASPEYAASLAREERLFARYCEGCEYDGYCNRQPMFHGHRDHPGRRCSVVYPLHRRIERAVVANGFFSDAVQAELARAGSAANAVFQNES